MKSSIVKLLLGLVLTINVILYPIGKLLSEPTNINNALTSIDVEQKLIDIFKEVIVQQLATNTGQTRAEIENQIEGDLISKESFKQQRETQVVKLYQDIEAKIVPNFTLKIENPVNRFSSSLQNQAKDFIDNLGKIEICAKGDQSLICQTLGDVINSTFKKNDSNTTQNEKPSEQATFLIETNFGINQSNINTWSNIYKVLRYGPDILLVIGIALLALYYLLTHAKTKQAISVFITILKADIFAFIVWGLFPVLLNSANPIRITSQTDIQGNVNLMITGAITETTRNALLIPALFTGISLVVILFSAILPKLSISRVIGESKKIEGYGTYDEVKDQLNEEDEGKDNLEAKKLDEEESEKVLPPTK